MHQNRVVRLGQNANEVLCGQTVQLDADREPALKFGDEVGHRRDVERACGDEQDVVRLDRSVLGVDRAALDDGQNVPLHALARHIGSRSVALCGDLVHLVDEDDALVFGAADSLGVQRVGVDQLFAFKLHERAVSLSDGDLFDLVALGQETAHHVHDVDLHAARKLLALCLFGQRDLHFEVVERAACDLLRDRVEELLFAEIGIGALAVRRDHLGQLREHRGTRGRLYRAAALIAHHAHRHLDKIADHRLDVPADVADLGELGRLDLDERCVDDLGEPPCDLRLAHAGRTLHDDVLGRDLVAQSLRKLRTAISVAQGDRDRLLRRVLSDDVSVKLFDYLLWGELFHLTPPRRRCCRW